MHNGGGKDQKIAKGVKKWMTRRFARKRMSLSFVYLKIKTNTSYQS